jgi:hypothetical protein
VTESERPAETEPKFRVRALQTVDTVTVYQAYRPEIGGPAARHGRFPAAWKRDRMTWIKPSFLWMMYRCGWATKEGQEVVLAVRILRDAFDEILRLAVYSSFKSEIYASQDAWKAAVASSNVRLQWEPDPSPAGGALQRRAIQLGLRGEVLATYARQWSVSIEDISDFVRAQRENSSPTRYDQLVTPRERVYPVTDEAIIENLRLQHFS